MITLTATQTPLLSMTMRRPKYTTGELVELSGATFRQCDYWARTGVLTPSIPAQGSGTQRRYSAEQVHTARILVRLSAFGMQGDAFRRAGQELGGHRGVVLIDEAGAVAPFGGAFPGVVGWLIDLDAP